MDISEVQQLVRKAREIIGPTPPELIIREEPEKKVNLTWVQCDKCLHSFPPDVIDKHEAGCCWECGLCAEKINSREVFLTHIARCAAKRTPRGTF